jgi:hypothetical protein
MELRHIPALCRINKGQQIVEGIVTVEKLGRSASAQEPVQGLKEPRNIRSGKRVTDPFKQLGEPLESRFCVPTGLRDVPLPSRHAHPRGAEDPGELFLGELRLLAKRFHVDLCQHVLSIT